MDKQNARDQIPKVFAWGAFIWKIAHFDCHVANGRLSHDHVLSKKWYDHRVYVYKNNKKGLRDSVSITVDG